MNAKRWVAVILAVVLFFTSVMVSAITGMIRIFQTESGFFDDFWESFAVEDARVIRQGDVQTKIAVLEVNGPIIQTSPGIFWMEGYNHKHFINTLKEIKNDQAVKAVVISVNSPGGGVYECAQIRDYILDLKQERDIPIYVSMGNMATSGGYYISADADKIFASVETLTGSIGVILSNINISGLMENLGIEDMTIKSGEHKDIGSSVRPPTEKDLELLQEMIDDSYERFVDVIATGRGMDTDEVREFADGRIFDGMRAKQLGLVDEIGYFDDALDTLIEDYELENPHVIKYSPRASSFFLTMDYAMAGFFKNNVLGQQFLEHLDGHYNSSGLMYLFGGW